MTSDSTGEILFSSQCAKSNHIIVVNENAKNVVAILKRLWQKYGRQIEQDLDQTEGTASFVSLRALLRRFKTEEERLVVQQFFRKSHEYVSE